jgi:hypothetical protein
MLKPTVLAGWVDPPGALQLVNPTQPLNPGGIDDIFLGPLGPFTLRDGEDDIAMDRVRQQGKPLVG